MVQKNYNVYGYEDLLLKISEIKKELYAYKYVDGVIGMGVGNVAESEVKKITLLLKNEFPQLKITGISSGSLSAFYAIYTNNEVKQIVTLSFKLFLDSSIKLFFRPFDRENKNLESEVKNYALELRNELLAMHDLKCVELCFAWIKASASMFIDELSKGLEDIPIYGAIANANRAELVNGYIATDNEDTVVMADEFVGTGISVIAYCGSNLYVYMDYLFGWEPIGRFLDVTTCETQRQGSVLVCTIDGEKPVDIYKKYLGVSPNSFFVSNISEFPLIIERNGMYIGRTPSGYNEKGEVYLEGNLLPGEKVRFSYGEYDEILEHTQNSASRMRAFGAEALSLVICGNRFNFLQKDFHREIDYFTDGREEEPELILGMGEIYRYHNKGGVLNSALVAVGMREGLGNETSSKLVEIVKKHEHEGNVPLAERLSHFLKAMTGELIDAVELANSANNAKSAFLSNMSHEIRTPINAVLGMDEMILRESSEDQILKYAANIKSSGNTLLSLINDILDFSKIEAGKMDIIPVEYDLSSVINDLVNMIKPRADEKNLELIIDIDESIPGELYGDEIRIKQIITNILTNAVKYTKEGSITLVISYTVIGEDRIKVYISVKDTGIGIRKEDLSKLYEAFQRVDEERNRTVEGTGLGLNITRKLVQLMGGNLEVQSEYGKGSEFSFEIEQRVKKWNPIGNYLEEYRKANELQNSYKEKFKAPNAVVLVVDDTPINITVFEGLLKRTLVQIDEATSGIECLEKTRQKKYDIIFLDHRMPGMDGIDTLKALKAEKDNPNNNTPAISLTANAVSGAREQYMEAGFDDYLTKPILSEKLEELMINYLPKEKVKFEEVLAEEAQQTYEPDFDWAKNITAIDIKAGITNCGSADVYMDAVNSFAENFDDNYADIRRFFEAEDIAAFTIKVHALKSSARIIGALELSRMAAELEKAGDSGNIAFIKDSTPRLLHSYKELFKAIEKEIEKTQGDDNSLPEIEKGVLTEALGSLKELAQSYDYDSIKFIMSSLSGYKMPLNFRKKIDNLKKAVKNADWEKIKKILDERDK